jgi:hypothetical protein
MTSVRIEELGELVLKSPHLHVGFLSDSISKNTSHSIRSKCAIWLYISNWYARCLATNDVLRPIVFNIDEL